MEWKNVRGYNGMYKVSSSGLVKSLDRYVISRGKPKKINERILLQSLSQNGYPIVSLCKNGTSKMFRIHQLVIRSFKGCSNKGMVVHHIDNNKLNNDINNLEYVSMQKNTQEYYKTLGKSIGTVPIGDIALIIDNVKNGHKIIDIAQHYNVSRNDIAVLCKIISLTGEELILQK